MAGTHRVHNMLEHSHMCCHAIFCPWLASMLQDLDGMTTRCMQVLLGFAFAIVSWTVGFVMDRQFRLQPKASLIISC